MSSKLTVELSLRWCNDTYGIPPSAVYENINATNANYGGFVRPPTALRRPFLSSPACADRPPALRYVTGYLRVERGVQQWCA